MCLKAAAVLATFLLIPLLHGASIPTSGGTLVVSARSEPKTLNPLLVEDTGSRKIVALLSSDLIHINSETQHTEPALASSWNVSPDGLRYTLHLRQGVRFSDGVPFDADDVLFSFRCYLDKRVQSPQRDLLIISGKPVEVRKVDRYIVKFVLPHPYAAAERLFDGIAMLPRHLLEKRLADGTLRDAWPLGTPPEAIAGLGPFRLKEYAAGEHLILERNPYYWKRDAAGRTLPYLDRIACLFTGSPDAELLRFEQGEIDIADRLSPSNFAVLARHRERYQMVDLGSGLQYNFLFFNQNALGAEPSNGFFNKQKWFKKPAFRKAVSSAIDRDAIVRLVYFGRADALATQVSPGDRLWTNRELKPPVRSLERARALLHSGGFTWNSEGILLDSSGTPVRFSLTVNAGDAQQVQMATLIQQDLLALGIQINLDSVDFHTFLDHIFTSFRYEAALMALADGDADPNTEMNVLLSTGTMHVWQLRSRGTPPEWQREIDECMQKQLITLNYGQRKTIFDRVQKLIWENMPVISLVSPHILVAAKNSVGNFDPAILGDPALWNADRLFLRR